MDADSLSPDMALPDNVPALQALLRQVLTLLVQFRTENAELKTKLDAALKHRFGRRSERQPRISPKEDKPPKKQARPHGRAPLPDHLERREVIHDLSEAEKRCPCCGTERACIGEQATEQLDLEPARFFVRRTIRKTYACRQCGPNAVPAEQRIQTAGPSQIGPIPRGLCGPGLLAHCVTAKHADHVPLHRLAGQLARSGVTIARSTLGDWLAGAAEVLMPFCALMQQRMLLSRVIHSDDTGVKLRVPKEKHTHQAHLWAYLGDADYPYVLFDFTVDYTALGPEKFLTGYQGYLQADALAQYEGLYGLGVQHVCCWAHARRKFVTALESGTELAGKALELIRRLYVIERELPALLAPSDDPVQQEQRRQREEERKRIRQVRAKSILLELKAWLDEQKPKALPKSPLGVAIGYALNNWTALERYVESGILSIDNNLSERMLRAIALGRNNWGVIGSAAGGKTAAVLYSIVGTCKHLGIDPFAYLRETLPGLFALGEKPTAEQLTAWLPDRWLLDRVKSAPATTG
jgi:transposase